jgi:hypothetical protein
VITQPLVPVSDGPDDEVLRARIVRRLARFGAGPAAGFRDACALMDGDPMVASDAHLVGHLLHELESSLRAALMPPGTQGRHEPPPEEAAAQTPVRGRMGAVVQVLGQLARGLAELIRALFLPPTRRSARTHAGEPTTSAALAHRLQVRAVLDSLGIAYDSDAGKTWLAYAALPHTWPPWQGPGAPRPVDQEFRRSFVNLLAMLDVVLERHEARYLASVDRLDALARAARPGDEHASELRQEFPQDPVAMGRFFSQLTSPAWIRPLRKQAFFAEPPAPVAWADGPGWQPDWPALRYLVRVARQDPSLATEVASDIPATKNQLVNACLVNLALEVPAAESVKLVPRITSDLEARSGGGYEAVVGYEAVGAEPPSALVLHLVDGGMPEAALGLARVLWGFGASPKEEDAVPGAVGGLRTRIAASQYAESLRTCLPSLAAGCGPAVLDVVADLLAEAITRTASPGMIESRQDLSTCWRPAVEGWPADMAMDARTALVSAVREVAAQLVSAGLADMGEVLRRLDRHDWPIFRRLALHLLRQFGADCKQDVAAWLTNPAAISDPCTEREYLLLAHDHFATLAAEDRQRVLHLIDEGPDVGPWVGSYAAQVGQEPPADQVDRWKAEWTRDRLGAIEPALPEQVRDSYRKLVRLVGEPAPAGKTRGTARFIRAVTSSPSSAGLAGWSVDSVISFLQTRPPATPAPTPDAAPIVIRSAAPGATAQAAAHAVGTAGPLASSSVFELAQELGNAVRASPLRYSAAAGRFADLAEPYVAQVLSGLAGAVGDGADLDWESALELCRRVPGSAAAGAERRDAAKPDGASGRREMILLLRAGLNHVPAVIPVGERVQVWHLIEASLSDGGSVTAGSGEGTAAARHEGTAAALHPCASVRAEALAAAVSYGMWVRRHQHAADLAEVFFVLDRHLDQAAEPSLAVRAVYGAEFHRLAQLSNAWAAGAASRIFPPGDADRELWEAAWDAYLDPLVPITSDACALLSDQYRLAVDRLGTGTGNGTGTGGSDGANRRDVRLGHHLITRYLAGEITLSSSNGGAAGNLIDAFYARASTAVRAEMTRYLGWHLLDPGTRADAGVLSRLTRLWERRLAAASPSADKDELVWFGDWFASGRFDADWSLRQLARVITLTGEAKPDILVLRRLAEIAPAPARTQLCLDIIDEWVRQLPDDAWLLSVREEYLSRILAAGLASPDAGTKTLAQEIARSAVRRGHTRFRGLVLTGAA